VGAGAGAGGGFCSGRDLLGRVAAGGGELGDLPIFSVAVLLTFTKKTYG
jgi:hypothetical protein